MKRNFTFLIAAVALLVGLAFPLGIKGQTTFTYKLTIDASHFNTTSYAANNNEKTINAICTTDNSKTYEVHWTSNQVMKNGNNMQWQKNNGYIYNSTDLGTITDVTVTSSAGTFTTYYGTSAQPSSGTTVGGGFFQTKVGNATGTSSKLEVTFQIVEGGSTATQTTTAITIPDGFNNDLKNGTLAGTLTASVTETVSGDAVSGATVTWESSNTDVATINASGVVTLVAVGATTITASYAGVEDEYLPSYDEYELEVVDSRFLISDLTFTEACGGTGTASTADHAVWTVTSDATESNFDSNRGIHYGTNSTEVTYVQLTTSDIDGQVTKVVVNASDAQGVATASVTVGGVAFTCTGSATVTNSNPGVNYTFTGVGSGEIVVRIARDESMTKAIYVKSVKVTYQEVAVKAPVITVPETFIGSTTATITCETTGATIYYSYDNSTWTEYTAVLTITQTTTIYAKAVKGTDESIVVSATTTRTLPEPTVDIDATGITNTDVYVNTAAGSLAATVTYGGDAISGATVTWSGDNNDVATINESTGAVTLVAAGTVNFTATFAGNADYSNASATYEFTVTSSEPASTYTLASSIVSGKTYIIVGFDGDDAYAMGNQNTNNRAGVAITVDGTTATGNDDVHEVVITALDGDDAGKYSIKVDGGYLYASSSSANQLKTETTLNDNGKWTIVIENGEATITAQGTSTRNLMRFNPNNGSPLFACYASNSTTGSLPKLYVKDETPATETYELAIEPYTVAQGTTGNPTDGWYLISSPVIEDITPSESNGFITNTYDLYRFNQNPTGTTVNNNTEYLEWENYKVHEFALVNGVGYLYSNSDEVTLTFTGTPFNGTEKSVELNYTQGNEFAGWNLVGNPFTTVAYADHSYFVMDESGTNIVATPVSSSMAINPFTGVFVQATATNQYVIFSKTASGTTNNKGVINLALSQQVNRGSAMVDKAVVSFNEGDQLGKFVFMESKAKLYIPKNGKDYAIAVAEGKGEMPVNFKAQENGTYTLNIDTENVEMNYLHLIDNMTGMDVDLLQTPSYTFDATTNDYTSRFRLVFSANDVNEQNAETFAFFSNGNWVVGNEGEATLQVIDVNGRIVSNETINGTVATSINATPGVYMLRLVNGNEVKTQKIVVR